jgi:hypothetical protein
MDDMGVGVDDAGGLTAAGDRDGLVVRYVSFDGVAGPTRRVTRGGDPEEVLVAAGGPGRRSVVAWQRTRRLRSDYHVEDLLVTSGQRGRVRGPTAIQRANPRAENVSGVAVGVSRRGEAILAWNSSADGGRPTVRYSVLGR